MQEDFAREPRAMSQSADFLPLRGIARVVIVLLAASVALAAARLAAPLAYPAASAARLEIDLRPLVVISRVTMVVTVIAFLIWFHRARINAERFDWRQRRARAWTFWGWIIPIGSLWIPFQLMGDIWRAGLPPDERSRTAWLPAWWWLSWLLAESIGISKKTMGELHFPTSWLPFAFFAIAGLTLIAIIGTVSTGPVGRPNPVV